MLYIQQQQKYYVYGIHYEKVNSVGLTIFIMITNFLINSRPSWAQVMIMYIPYVYIYIEI